ncbi:hypothetical protein [Caulobacter sp. LARHSG274]
MAYVFVFPLAVTLVLNRDHWPDFMSWLNSGTGAAWAQGFFSVIAIGSSAAIAIHVDQRAARRLRIDREAATLIRYQAGRKAIADVADLFANAHREFEAATDGARFDPADSLRWASNTLDVLEYYLTRDLTAPAIVYALAGARRIVRALRDELLNYDESGRSWARSGEAIDFGRTQIRSLISDLDNGLL